VASLKKSSLEDILHELQERMDCGVVALQLPDSESNLYLWWGSRTFCLGLTSRLAHGINCELEELEEGSSESGAIESDAEEALDQLAKEFPQHGMYL
jgi:hypothetical protein